jgi:[ribosomal protein S18]-alanine N-acetyltransferase
LASLRIVFFREAHLPRIMPIERASFGEDAYPRSLFREWQATPGSLFLVARAGSSVAGYALGFAHEGAGEIVSIAVACAFRGKGVGGALMGRLVEKLAAAGAMRVELMVRPDNLAAIRLYRRFGFRRVRRVPGYYEDGGDAWLMRK